MLRRGWGVAGVLRASSLSGGVRRGTSSRGGVRGRFRAPGAASPLAGAAAMAQAPAVGCCPRVFLERRLRSVLRVRSELSLFAFSMYVSAGIPAPAQLARAHLELELDAVGQRSQAPKSDVGAVCSLCCIASHACEPLLSIRAAPGRLTSVACAGGGSTL